MHDERLRGGDDEDPTVFKTENKDDDDQLPPGYAPTERKKR
jgi:hypothetical protein